MPSFLTQLSRFVSQRFILFCLFIAGIAFLPTFVTTIWAGNWSAMPTANTPPEFYFSTSEKRGKGGLLSYTTSEQPAFSINMYQDTQYNATFSLYQVSTEYVLSYFIHDDKGNQVVMPPVDENSLVARFDKTIQNGSSTIDLPIQGAGSWIIKIDADGVSEQLLIVRSKTGIVINEADNALLAWAQDTETGRKQQVGTLSSYNLESKIVLQDTKSLQADGTALLNADANTDILLYQADGDLAIVPVNLKYFNSDYYYQRFSVNKAQPKTYIFTDRPLYKPGDEIKYKVIGRMDDDARYTPLTGAVRVELYAEDSYDKPVAEQQLSFDGSGSLDGSFTLPAERTGWYDLVVKEVDKTSESKWDNVGDVRVQVEEYRKPEYTIELERQQQEAIKGQPIKATVTGNYFSGQPLSNQEVTYKVISNNAYSSIYWDYRQYESEQNYDYGYWFGDTIDEGAVTLDGQGQATITVDNNKLNDIHRLSVLTIQATFSDSSGNPVQRMTNVLLHPASVSIYNQTWRQEFQLRQPGVLNLIVSDLEGNPVKGSKVEASFKHTRWYKASDGSYKEEHQQLTDWKGSSDKDGVVSLPIDTQYVGSQEIVLRVYDKEGRMEEKNTYVWVSDGQEYWYDGAYESGLTIKSDKERYTPGESVNLTISSQITGRDALITFQRGRVDRYKVVSLESLSTSLTLPLESDDLPNTIIDVVSFSKDSIHSSSVDILVATDEKKLQVSLQPDKEHYGPGETVTLDIKTTDQQGSPVSSEVTVWAVDKAIFELSTNYVSNIFEFFWQKRWGNTMTGHSLEGINVYAAEMGGCFVEGTMITMADGKLKPIEKIQPGEKVLTYRSETDLTPVTAEVTNKHSLQQAGYLIFNGGLKLTANHILLINGEWVEAGSAQIGDTLTGSRGESVKIVSIEWQADQQNVYNLTVDRYHTFFANGIFVHNDKGDESRSVLKDTAYWNPAVKTDSSGRATVRFTLPDDLTTWTIAGVAATEKTEVGQSTTEIVVSKPVIVRPHLPNILRIGDEVVLSAVVQNTTEQNLSFSVKLETTAAEIEQSEQTGIMVKAGGTAEVFWKVKPTAVNTEAAWTFSAQVPELPAEDGMWDSITVRLPVYQFGFVERQVEHAQNDATIRYSFPADSDKDESYLEVQLAASALGILPSVMTDLIEYPYGCMEQTTSRFVPILTTKAYPQLFPTSSTELEKKVEKGIERLAQHELPSGGWSWWTASKLDPYVTYYVLEQLVWAKQLGYEVPDEVLSNAQTALSTFMPTNLAESVAKEAALALLDKRQVVVENFTDASDADLVALAIKANAANGFSELAAQQQQLLLSKAQQQGDTIYWQGGANNRFGSVAATTAMAIEAMIATETPADQISPAVQYLINSRGNGYWYNTFANARVIKAVSAYAAYSQETETSYKYVVQIGSEIVAEGNINRANQLIEPIRIPLANLRQGSDSVTITKTGTGQLYSTVVSHQLRTDRTTQAVSKGMTISRTYLVDGEERTQFVPGDEVTVQLKITGNVSQESYKLIKDILPAGMIPINEHLNNQQAADGPVDSWWSHATEYQLDGAEIAIPYSNTQDGVYSYQARVISAGQFYVPPASVILMYSPEVYGRTEVTKIEIQPKGTTKLGMKLFSDWPVGNLIMLIGRVLLALVFLGGLAALVGWQRWKHRAQSQETMQVEQPTAKTADSQSQTSVTQSTTDSQQPPTG